MYNYMYDNARIYLDRKKEKYDKLYNYYKKIKPDLYEDVRSTDPLIKHRHNGIPIVKISEDFT